VRDKAAVGIQLNGNALGDRNSIFVDGTGYATKDQYQTFKEQKCD
jgi:hypothetical protein